MNEDTRKAIHKEIAARMAWIGDQWRVATNYKSTDPLVLPAVEREVLAAELLARDLCQDEDPARAADAAVTLLRSLYADEIARPELWGSAVGRRIAWIMPIPGNAVPAKIAAALLGFTRQRIWQLVGMERLASVEQPDESIEIDTGSLYRYYNPRGTLAGQPDQR